MEREQEEKMNNVLKDTRKLTFMGVMLAITIILDVTPLGAIPIGNVSATVVHIPTIITGIILGPIAGLIMGFLLGITSLLHALTRPVTAFDPLFVNPLVSVLPRMFIGVMAYVGYTGMKFLTKRTPKGVVQPLCSTVGGVIGSLTNTILVLSMLYIIYAQKIVEALGAADKDAVKVLFIGIITTNSIIEAIVAGVITSAVTVAYFKYFQKSWR